MNDTTTDTAWAVTWLTSTGPGVAIKNGEIVRSFGKDAQGYLVAVRTDSGTYPVENLQAVLAHRREEQARAAGYESAAVFAPKGPWKSA